MDEKNKTKKTGKAPKVFGIIFIIIGILLLLLGIVVLLKDLFNLGEDSLIKHFLSALDKWYVLLICFGGGLFCIVCLGIGLCNYDPSDINKKSSDGPDPSISKALIPGSKRMYIKGDLFGCTNCEWSCAASGSAQPIYKCKHCGSYNCQNFTGTNLTICKDCGSIDTKLVCPKCGHDIKTNQYL